MPRQKDKHPIITAGLTRRQSETHRASLSVSKIIMRLEQCAAGAIEMSATQLNANFKLLDKAMPNLSAVEISQETPPEALLTEEQIISNLMERLDQMPDVKKAVLDRLLPLINDEDDDHTEH